eukprot:9319483-Pyramimonas_sp.AAC.1
MEFAPARQTLKLPLLTAVGPDRLVNMKHGPGSSSDEKTVTPHVHTMIGGSGSHRPAPGTKG